MLCAVFPPVNGISKAPVAIAGEIAELFASNPTPQRILEFHPTRELKARAHELLAKSNAGTLDDGEGHELQQSQNAELLMRLVKARMDRDLRANCD